MNNKRYIDHLIRNLLEHKQNVLRQRGKSDIEPYDYVERAEKWYTQIFEYVNVNPPKHYVKSVNIIQDSCQKIHEIKYVYYDEYDYSPYIAINLFGD